MSERCLGHGVRLSLIACSRLPVRCACMPVPQTGELVGTALLDSSALGLAQLAPDSSRALAVCCPDRIMVMDVPAV